MEKGTYRTAQICLNGHPITDDVETSSESMQNYCEKCGAGTIFQCPACDSRIRGYHYFPGVVALGVIYKAPGYCHDCGKAYPWTEEKIKTAIQIFAEFGNLEDSEKKTIEQDITNVAKDIPQSELSAMRIKRIWDSGRECARELLVDIASSTAAKVLKGQ